MYSRKKLNHSRHHLKCSASTSDAESPQNQVSCTCHTKINKTWFVNFGFYFINLFEVTNSGLNHIKI